MKRNLLYYAIILLPLAMFSCKSKDSFTISGTITNPGSLKKIYLIKQDSAKISVIDSTNLSDQGKFQFKYAAPYANLYEIRVGGTVFDLIAQNGDQIDFSTNLTDKTKTYQVTGSEDSQKIKEFNKLYNVYADQRTTLSSEYEEKAQALGKESDSLISIYMPKFQAITNAFSDKVLQFVDQNKFSMAGVYAISALDPNKYEQQQVAYAEAIKGHFKDNPSVQAFITKMMEIKPVTVGQPAPDFTVGGLDGKPIKLSDYKGKYVMLDFWASWCAPCRHENPNVVKQYAIYKPKGLNILGISLDVDHGAWQQAVTHDNLSWAHGSDLKNFEGPTERLYHIEAIPSNYILNPDGVIIAKNLTGADLEEFLNKTFNKPQ
jgi:peroxiredoxin